MINLRPLYCVSHQIAGPKTAPCRPGATLCLVTTVCVFCSSGERFPVTLVDGKLQRDSEKTDKRKGTA